MHQGPHPLLGCVNEITSRRSSHEQGRTTIITFMTRFIYQCIAVALNFPVKFIWAWSLVEPI